MTDERIRLILELAGASDVADLAAKLGDLNAAGATAATGLGQVEAQLREETAAIAEAVAKQRELKAATDACAAADRDLNKALRDDAAAELRAQLAALDAEAGDVAEAFARGDLSARMFAKDMDLIGDESAQLKGQLAGLEQATRSETAATDKATAAKDRLGKAAKKAGQGMVGFSQATLQTGRIVQDVVQGGIGGGINNIEGFVQAIGLGSGAAGALTILGTAFLVLRPQIEEFVGSVGALWKSFQGEGPRVAVDVIKELEKQIKELSEKPMRLRVEQVQLDEATRKLDALKRGLAEFNAQQQQQNVHEAESGKLVQESLTESDTGAAGIEDKAVAAIRDRMERANARIPEAEAEKAAAEADLIRARKSMEFARDLGSQQQALRDAEDAQRRLTAARLKEEDAIGKVAEAAKAEYGALVARAKTGHGRDQAEAQADLAKQLRGVGEGEVAGQIEADTPGKIKAADDEIDEAERFGERAKAAGEARRHAAKILRDEQKQQVDDLSKSEALAPEAQGFAKAANADGAAAEDAFEVVREQITAAILEKLRAKGLSPEGAEKIANDAAESIAKKAFDKVGQNQTRAEKAEAKGAARDEKGELAAILAVGQLAPPPARPAAPPPRPEAPKAPKAKVAPAPKAKAIPPTRRPAGARARPAPKAPPEPPKADRLEDLARTLVEKARAEKLDPEGTLKAVKDGIAAALVEALKARGIAAPDRAKVEAQAEKVAAKAVSPKGFVAPATDAEADRIERVLGKRKQAEYEAKLAGDAAFRAGNGPVARTPQQERQFQRAGGVAGVDYGLPAGVLEKRLRADLEREFKGRNATPAAAREAARRIGDRGDEDLSRKAADFGARGLGVQKATLGVARQLATEYQQMSGAVRQLEREVGEIGRQIRATRQSNQKRMR